MPAEIKSGKGSFELSAATIVEAPRASRGAADAARYLADLWQRTNGIVLAVRSRSADAPTDSLIRFERQTGYGPEAYRVEVAPHRIIVSASTATGLFYGAVTLWQLMPAGPKSGAIAAQTIIDEPRYAWRGLMLDSSRHFQSPAFVRSMIDWMAWHKLNVLHWHLTDDQGWRLEITTISEADIGGVMAHSGDRSRDPAPKPYGGYLHAGTGARHRRLRRHAPRANHSGNRHAGSRAGRGRRVSGNRRDRWPPSLPVSSKWGVHPHLFNLEPGTFEFLQNVLDEVMQLFPSRYMHIGGDEAVKDRMECIGVGAGASRATGHQGCGGLANLFHSKDRPLFDPPRADVRSAGTRSCSPGCRATRW